MSTYAESEAAAREWTEHAVRLRLASEANQVIHELERQAGHATAWLDDPRSTHPQLAGMRARLLSVCLQVGAVALKAEQEGSP